MTTREWYVPSKPMDIKPLPWLHADAIAYLKGLLRSDMTVLEHGSGGSTLWFAERVQFVVSVEHDIDWQMVVKKNLDPGKGVVLSSLNILLSSPAWSDMKFDLLLIDGEPVEMRAEWLRWALQLVKPGGYIVLDNANRPEYAKERETLGQYATLLHTVNGNAGACMYLITEFYQL